jgi:hypothetical protein
MNRTNIIIPAALSKVSKVVNTGGSTPQPPSVVVHERQHAMNNYLDHAPAEAADYSKVPYSNDTTGVWELAETEEATFIDLPDTPSAYTAGSPLRVNDAGDAIVFVPKIRLTDEGGFAVHMTNKTGAVTVKGEIVSVSTAYDNAAMLGPANGDMPIGVFYESGIADGSEVWVVVSGIADVMMKNTVAPVHGYVAFLSDTAGRADCSSGLPSAAQHFREMGHLMESKTGGTSVLSKIVLHFN